MPQRTSGLYSLLSFPRVYSFLQDLLGARKSRNWFVAQAIRPSREAKILDIGCGPADILESLGDVQYFGLDLSPQYIQKARERFGGRGTFATEDAREIPADWGTDFNVVIAGALLHHLDDQAVGVLFQTVNRLLADNG